MRGSVLDALLPRTRQGILAVTLGHPEKAWYTAELARRLDVPPSSLQRDLKELTAVGILKSRRGGGMTYFQANEESPVYPELRGLMLKTAGLVDVLAEALAPLTEEIRIAFVYGSIASGTEESASDVDLLLVGILAPVDLVLPLRGANDRLSRDIHPKLYTPAEFAKRRAARDHFLARVLEKPKLFVIGSDDELDKITG